VVTSGSVLEEPVRALALQRVRLVGALALLADRLDLLDGAGRGRKLERDIGRGRKLKRERTCDERA
jgi:hypothetical protein